jgi:hypothetical protein
VRTTSFRKNIILAGTHPLLKLREDLLATVTKTGFSFCPSAAMQAWLLTQSPDALSDWSDFANSWNNMPLDEHMADGGRYRRRRYAVLNTTSRDSEIVLAPHQPHYQSLNYNALNGGIARDFEAIQTSTIQSNSMQSVLKFCQTVFSELMPNTPWHIECHQFRIEANDEAFGKPTPEGIHRDGVDFVLVMMVKRQNISSGTTTMHDLEHKNLDSFTLTEPLDVAIVNDHRCMHGVTPIVPLDPTQPAYRDVLVVTFKKFKQ